MRIILTLLALTLFLTVPVFADVNQKANLNGERSVDSDVNVKQTAWNEGSGNINQDINVSLKGNKQVENMLDQDGIVLIGSDYEGNVNDTIKGRNLIKIDLSQYGKNTGSGNIDQGLDVKVEDNIQIMYQRNKVRINLFDSDYTGNINNTMKGLNLIKIDSSQYGKNTGSGNINQDMDVDVAGNKQILNQNNVVGIGLSDSDNTDYINITLRGLNLILNDMSQYGKNTGSIGIGQTIGTLIDGTSQKLDQIVKVFINNEPETAVTPTPTPGAEGG